MRRLSQVQGIEPMKRLLPIALLVGVALVVIWWLANRHGTEQGLVLYGNVDVRQVDLPFNASERVTAVLAQEGDHVKKGQLLAQLDTTRLEPQVAKAEADVAAQQQVVNRLRAGSRPQEIAQGRANVESARADAANARSQYERLLALFQSSSGRAVSHQDIDSAKAAVDVAEAKLAVNRKGLDLTVVGPRKEDIAQAEAQLRSDEAQLALLRRQLADANLTAPLNAVVRSRIVEPGEIASPQKSAFTLSITDPKWIRAYISERDLGHVREGARASITVDAFPNRAFDGWVGFISPVAEFTPKEVQTEELRSSLVYEIRVFVKDSADDLRLGMPATVHLSMAPSGATASTSTAASVPPQPGTGSPPPAAGLPQ